LDLRQPRFRRIGFSPRCAEIEADIDLTTPEVLDGFVVVAMFHTHPNPMRESWITGPSDSDTPFTQEAGVPSLIRAEDATQLTGPASRRGGLTGKSRIPRNSGEMTDVLPSLATVLTGGTGIGDCSR
jgi:hypothetical protein